MIPPEMLAVIAFILAMLAITLSGIALASAWAVQHRLDKLPPGTTIDEPIEGKKQ